MELNLKKLKFIHITKTGGTSIEAIGKENNIRWGRFHKEYKKYHKPFLFKSNQLKSKYDWFTVVRNPYDRVISEFYCKYGTKIKENKYKLSKSKFNKILQSRIKRVLKKNKKKWNYKLGDKYHYFEQYKYIDFNNKIHILKFENLEEEFNNLMKKYSLNITLSKHKNKNKKKYTIESLQPDTIKLINRVYHKDFELFGYEKILND